MRAGPFGVVTVLYMVMVMMHDEVYVVCSSWLMELYLSRALWKKVDSFRQLAPPPPAALLPISYYSSGIHPTWGRESHGERRGACAFTVPVTTRDGQRRERGGGGACARAPL
jgi:hypothetical protein